MHRANMWQRGRVEKYAAGERMIEEMIPEDIEQLHQDVGAQNKGREWKKKRI